MKGLLFYYHSKIEFLFDYERIMVRANDDLHKLNRAEVPENNDDLLLIEKRNSRHNAQIYFRPRCILSSYTCLQTLSNSLFISTHVFTHSSRAFIAFLNNVIQTKKCS